MGGEKRLRGIVLKDSPVGEYDKRVTLITIERGKVSAFLRGAKRPSGSSLAGIAPFTVGEFFVYEGKNSYTVVRAEVKEYFESIKADLTKLSFGAYFLESAEYYSVEGGDEEGRMGLLYAALKALEAEKLSPELIRLIFELKNIAIMGEYPNVFSCGGCKTKEDIIYFSMEERRGYCKNCGTKGGLIPVSSGCAYALWFIFTTPPKNLFSFTLSKETFLELRDFSYKYIGLYFNHKFKTLDMIGELTSP